MIFPEHCKYVGHASGKPCGDRVYFLSRYLLHETTNGTEVLDVTLAPAGKGMMREIASTRVLATADQVYRFPEKVQLHDRTHLIQLALDSGYRCTVFTGLDEHTTFVLDPDLLGLLEVHVYDISPPRPSLSMCLRELEAAGLFGDLSVRFCHHVRDIREISADVYPCRAGGFDRTLDKDPVTGGELIAGCMTGSQLCSECHAKDITLENICPLAQVREEPFIARCCRAEREGIGTWNGKHGIVVHWGASPAAIACAVNDLVVKWRMK
jgi:hypothetical protein